MAIYSVGRVILHGICIVRHPQNFDWHWHGLLREFGAAPGLARALRTSLTCCGLLWLALFSESQAAQPSLAIQRVINGVRLSWPHSDINYVLEQTPGFDDSWGTVDAMYELSDAGLSVTLPAEYETRFFRLRAVVPTNSAIFVARPGRGFIHPRNQRL